jgi:hypothetical protein
MTSVAPPPSTPPPKAVVHAEPQTNAAPARGERVDGEVSMSSSASGNGEHSARDAAPDHELVAPVEMWFGDHRVGVKAGTRTYDLFQKYARVLFDDLERASTSASA